MNTRGTVLSLEANTQIERARPGSGLKIDSLEGASSGVAIPNPDTIQEFNEPFHYSDIAVSVPATDNELPEVGIAGLATLGGNGRGVRFAQNTYIFNDDLAWTKGRHSFRFGGGIDRGQNDETAFHYIGALWFGSFTDFLLGQDSIGAGTEALAPIGLNFSNILASIDLPGLFDRAWRVWNYNAYAQDDFKVGARLTVNAGFRFEHLGDLGDQLGRNASFDPPLVDPDPVNGSLKGFVVSNNYPGTVPAGVSVVDTDLGIRGEGQNTKFEFVAQFFNAFNTPQFDDPDTFRTPGSSTFGTVSTTAVAPRIMQFALKLSF